MIPPHKKKTLRSTTRILFVVDADYFTIPLVPVLRDTFSCLLVVCVDPMRLGPFSNTITNLVIKLSLVCHLMFV
jgi:hypothetical protein